MKIPNDSELLARKLGLAPYSLFGNDNKHEGCHFALMDGANGSFLFSQEAPEDILQSHAFNWSWSADVKHHVSVSKDIVTVRKSFKGEETKFSKKSVFNQLDKFYRYLETDTSSPAVDSIDHIITTFRNFRNSTNYHKPLSTFLLLLASYLNDHTENFADFSKNQEDLCKLYNIPVDNIESVSADILQRFNEELKYNRQMERNLDLGITIRHAGGALFQEAQTSLSEAARQLTLFGFSHSRASLPNLANGGYFTPQGIARSLTEAAIQNHLSAPKLRILDPACGSGTFLCEAIRTLQRFGYSGKIELIGVDISDDAIEMANFSIACAIADWPGSKIHFKLMNKNFLSIPNAEVACDIVLTNPPFQSWSGMTQETRSVVKEIMKPYIKGRPDLSIGFTQKSMDSLHRGGTLATILPIGVLTSNLAKRWRDYLAEENTIDLISLLGDHTLFRYASVNISTLIIQKKKPSEDARLTMLWADESNNAAANALRNLRLLDWIPGREAHSSASYWNIYNTKQTDLKNRYSWTPNSTGIGPLLEDIKSTTTTTVDDFFNVKQGIRPGNRDIFIVSKDYYSHLSKKEQDCFKPIAEKDAIANGSVTPIDYIFYPVPQPANEDELRERCPFYYQDRLLPNKMLLASRARKSDDNFWILSEPRAWMFDDQPRIISKAFYRKDGFVLDSKCRFAIVQGFGWTPKSKTFGKKDLPKSLMKDILVLYLAIFNSDIFTAIAMEYSSRLRGGYLEVANKYMKIIPLPDLTDNSLFQAKLANLSKTILDSYESYPELNKDLINEFTARAYKTRLEDWNIVF